jgi:DNA-binding IclR family transcriptional regulator
MATPIFAPRSQESSIVAEGRVLDAVAARDLRGTIDQIADSLGLSASHLRAAISALGAIGWVQATYDGDGHLWLCLGDDLR